MALTWVFCTLLQFFKWAVDRELVQNTQREEVALARTCKQHWRARAARVDSCTSLSPLHRSVMGKKRRSMLPAVALAACPLCAVRAEVHHHHSLQRRRRGHDPPPTVPIRLGQRGREQGEQRALRVRTCPPIGLDPCCRLVGCLLRSPART